MTSEEEARVLGAFRDALASRGGEVTVQFLEPDGDVLVYTAWQQRLINEAQLDPDFSVGACYPDPAMWAVKDAENTEVARCPSELFAQFVADALNTVMR